MDWLPEDDGIVAVEAKYTPRDYQSAAVEAALNFCKYMEGNGYLVLPTASGKSIVMAHLAEKLKGRVLLLAHRKELLRQNASKFTEEVGIYSAGLDRWELDKRITVAGIQSIANANIPAPVDWIIIDEAHRLPDKREGQYWELIERLGNPRIIGFTATNFRLDGGLLSWGEVIFSIGYQPLIDKKYLTPLINKIPPSTAREFNADVKLGDYVLSQLEDELIDPELLRVSVEKIREYSVDRHACLIFCATIKHGELVQAVMKDNGLYAIMVTGDTPAEERDQIAEEFKHGEIKYVINCQIWTEGFDAPNIDMIAVLRPTKSKALHEQVLGRAIRIHLFTSAHYQEYLDKRKEKLQSQTNLSGVCQDAV
jgi:DNA repair protein RadD